MGDAAHLAPPPAEERRAVRSSERVKRLVSRGDFSSRSRGRVVAPSSTTRGPSPDEHHQGEALTGSLSRRRAPRRCWRRRRARPARQSTDPPGERVDDVRATVARTRLARPSRARRPRASRGREPRKRGVGSSTLFLLSHVRQTRGARRTAEAQGLRPRPPRPSAATSARPASDGRPLITT